VWRAGAAGLSVIVAAVAGVVTALVTAHPSSGLWAALVGLVIVGAALQVSVTAGDRGQGRARMAEPDDQPRHGTVSVRNVISGGTQHGSVQQGRDFTNLTFGTNPAVSADNEDDVAP
jgi:hypothetical protein